MNTSQFMDKQIMDLSSSQNKNNADKDFMDLNSHPPQDDHHHHHDVGGGDDKKDEILPNYDFQPIRPIATLQPANFDSSNVGGTRVWTSAESKTNFGTRNYGSLDSSEPSKAAMEKDRTICDAALISEIDRTMKKHTDNLMHALEGVSARLSQLESRSRNLENSVDDLRISVGNNHGNTDGKLRQIENMIREVQSGVQVVKDKQEILETQLQLSQVQISKVEQRPEPQIAGHIESLQQQQQAASVPLQSHQQPSPPALPHQLPPTLPNAPPQNMTPPVHHPNQFPQNIIPISHHDPYYPPPQTAEQPPQQYQLPPPQLQPPKVSPPSPQPQYQPPPTHMQYSQPPPMSLQHPPHSNPNPSQNQLPPNHHSEEPPYLSSQSYPPSIRQPGGGPPTQQFQGNPSQMYEPPSGRSGPGFSSQYGPSPGFSEPYNFGGSQYGSGPGSPMKSQQLSSPGSGSGYPQLPTARILPQALPTAATVGGGGGASSSGSGNGGNRVPIDDVVDKVTNMGFPRDQVRATVRKLTENGQAVDLNVVLDKLMTDGVESQGPRAWFGR
ncbi:mediator of RNA polymerase II transcription subunit 15 [Cynara cardunculus var. scolymus]|uniref:UBA domain-containing protein n=1 Tax=Cynara cardunculus var. scolymus TaxID=59895 RepID=A0A103Y4P3_CYNCS|nr:mediator of RNA polymerase II transcription subunit 15 [Cynara cardunculus var. scolymus]KVI02468.1 hypothetical protein Ccrd_019238 [Cynara cardunculus var. scolymus]